MLTVPKVENAKLPAKGEKPYKLSDAGKTPGLYLLLTPSGKYWRWDYRLNSKRRTFNIGTYPDVSLAEARKAVMVARAMVREGIDPVLERKRRREAEEAERERRRIEAERQSRTVAAVTAEWLAVQHWAPSYRPKVESRLQRHVLERIGHIPVAEVSREALHDLLLAIAKSGKVETAKRCAQYLNSIMEFACNAGWLEVNPMPRKMKWPEAKSRRMPAIIEPAAIGELLRAIEDYRGRAAFQVWMALRMLPYVATRPGEFRHARWQDFDLEQRLWVIPAEHRKLRTAAKRNPENVHLVPLSWQVLAMLEELRTVTGNGPWLFPSEGGKADVISENTLNKALHVLGYKGRMVAHGWRAAFSSLMNERGYNPDAIERQLAHDERNAVRRAYMRADFLEERRRMMQAWADWLDALRDGAQVVPIKRKA